MKIAIDNGPLTSGDSIRGVGFYTKELIKALEIESKKEKDLNVVALDSETLQKRANEFDVIHIPYFNPFFPTIPTDLPTKVVVTIHDIIPLLYPDKYVSGFKGKVRLKKQKRALTTIDAVITDSEASKKDIVRLLGVPKERIVPTHLAAASHFRKLTSTSRINSVRTKFNLPDTFVLYVGDVNYNKNISVLVKATLLAKVPLVIVGKHAVNIDNFQSELQNLVGPRDWIRYLFGKPHPELAHYHDLLELFKYPHVKRLGFVSDEDLVGVYNAATLYCQPSFAEGFGFPVVEAFACGTPVVISQSQALVEIADGAAALAKNNDEKDFAKKISKMITGSSYRNDFVRKAKEKSKEYTWKKTARETIAVYRRVCE